MLKLLVRQLGRTKILKRLISSELKHSIHCLLLFAILAFFTIFQNYHHRTLETDKSGRFDDYNRWAGPGTICYLVLFGLRLLTILDLPRVVFTVAGLTLFNAFPAKATRPRFSPSTRLPLVCVRVVTRGNYPDLVRQNAVKNKATCLEAGLRNFVIEVVTDKPIELPKDPRIRQIQVPTSYRPKRGALFKARALQYCLEDAVNELADDDYILHLDEETIMTYDSVCGIIDFIREGKYDFGQGLITYANEPVVNWITTLADSARVADDMGKLRAQFSLFHKPIFHWKGSYILAKLPAERDVSFDHGIRGSVTEDCYFALEAMTKDYKFAFVEGEMRERSPFTIRDYIRQRKRWTQGVFLAVHSPDIAWKYKIGVAVSFYALVSLPLSSLDALLRFFVPFSTPLWLNLLCSFTEAVNFYSFIFGTIKSVSLDKLGIIKYSYCIVGSLLVKHLSVLMDSVAVILGMCTEKKVFYIVDKDIPTSNTYTKKTSE